MIKNALGHFLFATFSLFSLTTASAWAGVLNATPEPSMLPLWVASGGGALAVILAARRKKNKKD